MSIAFYAAGLILNIGSIFIGLTMPDAVLSAIYSSTVFVSGIGLIAAGGIIEAIKKIR